MTLAVTILFAITTLGIAYQDFKYRAIHVLLLILLLAVGIADAVLAERPLQDLLFSFGFVVTVLSLMMIYLRLKTGYWLNPLKEHLGLGDVLFFIAVIPLFSPHGYLWFFISGLLGSVVVYSLFRHLIGKQSVPLAGMLSAYLLGLKILESQWGYSMFNLNFPV